MYWKNPMIGYLNINHFENEVINFREISHQAPIDTISVDETKLGSSYPDSQFHIDGCQCSPFSKDRKQIWRRQNCLCKRRVHCKKTDKFRGKYFLNNLH